MSHKWDTKQNKSPRIGLCPAPTLKTVAPPVKLRWFVEYVYKLLEQHVDSPITLTLTLTFDL